MSEGMTYAKSKMPLAGANGSSRNVVQQETGGQISYPSMRGMETVSLPEYTREQRPDSVKVETVQIRHLPKLITSRIESALVHQGDDEATRVLAHYTGALRGAELLNAKTDKELESLASGFAGAKDKGKFFAESVEPFFSKMSAAQREE